MGLKTESPIIPMGIRGTEEALPLCALLPKRVKLVGLRIGNPFSFERPDFDRPEPDAVIDALIAEKSRFVMARIDELR